MPAAPAFIRTLVDRYDPAVFDTRRRPTRVRLAAGVDEFLRAYLTPAGRAAFYAAARHLELDCGHVPQVERPKQTHAALAEFLSEASYDLAGAGPHLGN
jgi:pimeloyl-ACP methyl ester carboxylesterase